MARGFGGEVVRKVLAGAGAPDGDEDGYGEPDGGPEA